jgi:HAMP domain-containing protein
MSGASNGSQATGTPVEPGATFELDRFTWAAPDRLELSGRFTGIGDAPGDAVLVVRGPDRVQRLPAVAGTQPPDASGRWQASFAWLEAPAAFDGATLELGEDLIVDLPAPRSRRRPFRHEVLPLRTHDGALVAAPATEPVPEPEPDPEPELEPAATPVAAAPATPPVESSLLDAAMRLRLQADLLDAREQARELEVSLERATQELARVRSDLEAMRAERDANAERFREGLASVRATAEETLAMERTTLEQARADAEAAGRAVAEELEAARSDMESAQRRADAAEQELATLRERVAAIDPARERAAAARTEAEQLLEHLTAMRDGLGTGT